MEEANAVLPAVVKQLEAMDVLLARRREVGDLLEDMDAYWGNAVKEKTHPDHAEYLRLHEELADVMADLNGCAKAIHDLGGHLKSPEQGLVDFYALRDGEPVFLCWQRGEEAVAFYHELDAGFRGRRPLSP